jgi:hypothetical protein
MTSSRLQNIGEYVGIAPAPIIADEGANAE